MSALTILFCLYEVQDTSHKQSQDLLLYHHNIYSSNIASMIGNVWPLIIYVLYIIVILACPTMPCIHPYSLIKQSILTALIEKL